jgi:hypothetical protein
MTVAEIERGYALREESKVLPECVYRAETSHI